MKYTGVYIPYRPFEPMRKALEKWAAFLKRYNSEMLWRGEQQDVSYWYRERSHVGMLASAIWSAGGIALEEYGEEKRHLHKRRPARQGRVDLYFSIGSLECVAEAKAHGMQLGLDYSQGEVAETLREWGHHARDDARCDPAYGRRLGLVFVSPWFKKPKEGGLRVQAYVELLIAAAKRLGPEFIAWQFDRSPYCDDDRHCWPGVLLIGNVLRRS